MKFWRPRISIRTLVILVTLVCAYFGAWMATMRYASNRERSWAETLKRNGIPTHGPGWVLDPPEEKWELEDGRTVYVEVTNVKSPFPLVVSQCETFTSISGFHTIFDPVPPRRSYYLWVFGPTIKLPFESLLKRRFPYLEPAPGKKFSSQLFEKSFNSG